MTWSRPRPYYRTSWVYAATAITIQIASTSSKRPASITISFWQSSSIKNLSNSHLCCDSSSLQNVVHHCKIVSVDCNESMYHNQSQSTPIPLNDTWYYTSRLSSTVYQSNFMQHLSIGARHQSTLKWWWIAIAKESMHVDGRSSWCSLSSIDWI